MFSSLFSSKIECPRCLGKGHVDINDIVRLGQELRWISGPCAYCRGKGKVSARMVSKIEVNNAYLTTDISESERRLLLSGDKGATQRAKSFQEQVDLFILQVEYLHFLGRMDAETIAEFFLISDNKEENSSEDRKAIVDYVTRIIDRNKQ